MARSDLPGVTRTCWALLQLRLCKCSGGGAMIPSGLTSAQLMMVVLRELVILGLQQAPISGSSLFGGLTWL